MNRGRDGNRGGGRGGNRGGGRGGNRGGGRASGGRWHYVSKGRSPRSADHYIDRRVPDGAVADWDDASSRSESSRGVRRTSDITSVDGVTKKFDGLLSSDYAHGPNPEPCGSGNLSPNDRNSKPVQSIPEAEPNPSNVPSFSPSYGGDNNLPSLSTPSEHNAGTPKIIQSQDHDVENFVPSYLSCTPPVDRMHKKKDPFLSTGGQYCQEVQTGKTELEGNSGKDEVENSDSQHEGFSFDIYEERNTSIPKLKSSLLVKNRATRNEKRRMQGDNIEIIRPGMVRLKCYISLSDQVKLIKSCRDLGRGPGGFYEPGYRDGAKLHLKMMCLGKNWDPEMSSYDDIRPSDQAKPPPIPTEFQQLVKDALHYCHCNLGADSKVRNARDFVLSMSPNICIINFYTKQGKLGLHQDKDESRESLDNGIPVVSISLGDSAEFLFGDQRDVDQAHKVVLESGDVLIFGGKSRHIFHGVSTIYADTAPKVLLEETGLRPGRLNLTFRQY